MKILPKCLFSLLLLAPHFACYAENNWIKPDSCPLVSGDGQDDPPVVEFYKNGKLQENAILQIEYDQFGNGRALLDAKTATNGDLLLMTISFTPFLSSYWTPTLTSSGQQIVDLPPAGYANSPAEKIFSSLDLTVSDGDKPLPRAYVMFEPNFSGSDAYTVQANDEGVVHIDCFQKFRDGNYIYVVSEDGSFTWEGTIHINDQVEKSASPSANAIAPKATGRNGPPPKK